MSKNKTAHTHQYKKVKWGKNDTFVYRCMLSDCTHYISPAFLLGRSSLCPSCHNNFIIDKYASQRTFPVCTDCRKVRVENSPVSSEPVDRHVADILRKLGVH